jgi:hypothetical protein
MSPPITAKQHLESTLIGLLLQGERDGLLLPGRALDSLWDVLPGVFHNPHVRPDRDTGFPLETLTRSTEN